MGWHRASPDIGTKDPVWAHVDVSQYPLSYEKVVQNSKGDWEEVSTEVYEYYYERLEIEQGGETLSISEDAVKEFRESKKK